MAAKKTITDARDFLVLAEAMPAYPGVGGDSGSRLIDLGNFMGSKYAPALGREAAKKTRHFCEHHWWIRTMMTLKMGFFFSGFRVVGANAKTREWLAKERRFATLRTFAGDVAREHCGMSNAAVVWTDWAERPWIHDLENVVSHSTWAGSRKMTIAVPANGDKAPDSVPAHWKKVWRSGGDVVLDEAAGDHFCVSTEGRSDKGFTQPAVMTALALYCTLEFLNRADWTASFSHGNVIRQAKKGFLLPGGAANNEGAVERKMTAAARAKLLKSLKAKTGGQDWVTQHDLQIAFSFLTPEFFDPTKYDGVMRHLRTWAGAVSELQDDKPSNYVPMQMRAEAEAMREKVASLIEDVVNDSPLLNAKGRPAGSALRVAWSPTQMWDGTTLVDMARFLSGQGAISQTTLREWFGLDNELEGDRLVAEIAKPDRYRPSFEAKQGMLTDKPGGDGRPQTKPNESNSTKP